MATGMTWILAIVAIGVVVLIIRMAPQAALDPSGRCRLGLVLGGALGNLIDRIFRSPGVLRGPRRGLRLGVRAGRRSTSPVFNVADSAITIGGIMLVITDPARHRLRRPPGQPRQAGRSRLPDPGRIGRRCLRSAGCRSPRDSPACGPTPGWRGCSG